MKCNVEKKICKGKCKKSKSRIYQKSNNERIKIINLIARKSEIKKICCICGRKGKNLHNKKNPYYITFICDKCRQEPNNLIIAKATRFDVRTRLDKKHLSVHLFSKKDIKNIIENYLTKKVSIGEYCESIGITRYQFNQIMQKYNKLHSKKNLYVQNKVKQHSNIVKSQLVKSI